MGGYVLFSETPSNFYKTHACGHRFESHRQHGVVSLCKALYLHCLVGWFNPGIWFNLTEKLFFVCFAALRPKSTAMVMEGLSVHLTTLFPGQV